MQVLESGPECGCGPNCCTMSDRGEFVVGTDKMVVFYDADGKGASKPFEGTKVLYSFVCILIFFLTFLLLFFFFFFFLNKALLAWFRNYLVIVSDDPNAGGKGQLVNIYNLSNQFNAFSVALPGLTHLCSEWGMVLLFSPTKIWRLEEKDTQTKLKLLFARGLFNIALSLAQAQNFDEASIIDIHRK